MSREAPRCIRCGVLCESPDARQEKGQWFCVDCLDDLENTRVPVAPIAPVTPGGVAGAPVPGHAAGAARERAGFPPRPLTGILGDKNDR
jgi:hypothetical protein